jgi:hypothetical protein
VGFPEWTARFSVWKTAGKDSSEACAIACQNCAVYSAFPSGMTRHSKIAQFNWECVGRCRLAVHPSDHHVTRTANWHSNIIVTVNFLVSSENCRLQRFYSYFLNFSPNFAAWCHRPVSPSAGVSNLWHAFTKWHLEFTALPICLYPLPDKRLYIVKNMCIYIYMYVYIYIYTHTHISDCIHTVYELPLLANNTVVKYYHTNLSGAKCWLDIYHWGAGLEVTEPCVTLDRTLCRLLFKREVETAPFTTKFFPYCTFWGSL